ncbi:sugar phosphate isomerase/epimerase family protein [Microbacterium sp. F51-2R]|uniref:sugar phosphate isomerase/epimerase family protein n=1 Tax=Microbacterium sp. F51-2R TaxID=3445777 RepID=UPI003FA123F9
MRKFTLSPLTVLPCSPLDLIGAAESAGYDGVGLRLIPTMSTDIDVMADAPLQDAIRGRLADSPLEVFDIEVVRAGPSLDLPALDAAMTFASGLGASWFATTSASLEEYGSDGETALVASLKQMCGVASAHGMGVMLEFMAFRGLTTLSDSLRVVSAVGAENLRITLDALHFFRSGGQVDDLAGLPDTTFACVQLCDAPAESPGPAALAAEARSGRLYPGQGGLPLRALLAELPDDVVAAVEVPNKADAHLGILERARAGLRAARSVEDHIMRRGK